jgi:simple sugar transport system substrate-binding protein/D-xylose transport system substrate-binding protein
MGRAAHRKARLRGLSALVLTAALAACGQAEPIPAGAQTGAPGDVIAFLMPDQASTRYERYDYPLFQSRVRDLCIRCEVIYSNAEAEPEQQRQQAEDALARGAKVLVMSSVDPGVAADIVEAAHARGAKVVAYDRPIVEAVADHYISYDNEAIGRLITESLLDRMPGSGAQGVLQVNGAPEDAAADLIQEGVSSVLGGTGVTVLASYDTPGWDPDKAQEWVRTQIDRFGSQINGVIASNDGTAGGAIAAFQAVGMTPPPVTGNDSELAAAQRILRGEQYNTISKPIRTVAEAAAAAAVQLLHGQQPPSTSTLFDTPSELFTPTVVTAANLKATLIDTGELEQLTVCTPEMAQDCQRAGIG